jgi:hypothetical protein
MKNVLYKGFVFNETYDLDDYFSIMHEELTEQFNEKIQRKDYFERQGFVLYFSGDEKIYENPNYSGYFFLDVDLVFPPHALACGCTICWKINEKGIPSFFWTTNFPIAELEEYVLNNIKESN